MFAITSPYPQIFDLDGSPLDGGKVYFGQVGTNPVVPSNRIPVYWDEAGTQPVAQPLAISNGYIYRSGTPAVVFADTAYSMSIVRKTGELIAYAKDAQVGSGFSVGLELHKFEEDLAASDGLGIIGSFQSYDALRAYQGSSKRVYVTGVLGTSQPDGIAGEFFLDASDSTSPDNGGTIIVDALGRRFKRFFTGPVLPTWFAAKGNGVQSDAWAFQRAMLYANSIGGAAVFFPTPPVAWLLDYPVYVLNNTEAYGTGIACRIIFKNPIFNKGRGGFVIGSSLEANRETALAAYAAGTYPGATTINPAFVNPAPGQFLRDNPSFVQARNSVIHDVYLKAEFDNPADWGGYGINIVNAWNCHAYRIWGEGWTQLVGMGSDVPPETPSNHLCTAKELHVVKPDLVHTYYAIGFIANSTDCEIDDGIQHVGVTPGSPDGSGVAVNLTEDCKVTRIKIPSLGLSTSSEGVLINNSKGCFVDDVYVGNARAAVSTFYTNLAYIDAARPNIIGPNITGRGCDTVLRIGSKNDSFQGLHNVGSVADVTFLNSNASANAISGEVRFITTPNDIPRRQYFLNNIVQGWRQRLAYFRPMYMLINDKADAKSWDQNIAVVAKAGVTLLFGYIPPTEWRAIGGVRAYVTYANNAAAAGTQLFAQIRRMAAFDGNTGTPPVIAAAVTDTATNSTTLDKFVDIEGVFIELDSEVGGLPRSHDVFFALSAPTVDSVMKHVRIEYFGD